MSKKIRISRAEIIFILLEVACILFYGFFTEFGVTSKPKADLNADPNLHNDVQSKYPLFQDVHVMIFIGFGFLMVFLKYNSWSSIGFNYLIACWAIQICIPFTGLWHNVMHALKYSDHHWEKIQINIDYVILADFGAAAVLISFGAILGKCTIFQLWIVGTLEILFYTLNESILMVIFQTVDVGGSMVIHTFGAFFGIAVTYFYQSKAAIQDLSSIGSGNYLSNLIAMIGTLFLFCYWPSFNSALAEGASQERAIFNTYLSITSSVIASAIISRITHEGKLEMEIILNASLAGGVAIGASADIIIHPYGAMVCGFVAGAVSSFGFAYLIGYLRTSIGLHDTCGVLNLHGIPGIIGGITSSIVASLGGDNFEEEYGQIFLAQGRSPSQQAGFQLAGLVTTLGIAILSGLLTGFITSRKCFNPIPQKDIFDDRYHWANCVIEFEYIQQMRDLIENRTSSFPAKVTDNQAEELDALDQKRPSNEDE